MSVHDGLHGPAAETSDVLLAALERANDAVVILHQDHHVSHFNAAAEQIWGRRREEILGREAGALGLRDLDEDRQTELTIPRPDGSRVRVALSLSHVVAGGARHTIVLLRNITPELELRERLALHVMIADGTNRAVVIVDRDMKIVYVNATFVGMFGHRFEEAQGRQIGELLAGSHTDRRVLARMQRCIACESGVDEEILAYDSNGEEMWLSAHVKAFRNARGKAKYVVALLADITESRQLWSLQQLIMTALADEIPITEIADQLCRRVEQIAPDVVSSLLHIDADGLVHPLGGPSLPEDYSRALDGVVIGPNVGSCGSAAYHGKAVLAMDIDTDPRWQPYKTRPLEVGLRACWSSPIKAKDGRVIGTFAFYFRECRAPSRWHQRIVDACVHLGALAIERKEARA
jgi:PAS domain S-box-containing protein